MTHLADLSALTDAQIQSLRLHALDSEHVDVRFVAGRAAIVHMKSEEPVQWITRADDRHVKWLVASWSAHFEAVAQKAREGR